MYFFLSSNRNKKNNRLCTSKGMEEGRNDRESGGSDAIFSKMKRKKEIEPRRKKTRKENEDDRKLDG